MSAARNCGFWVISATFLFTAFCVFDAVEPGFLQLVHDHVGDLRLRAVVVEDPDRALGERSGSSRFRSA